MYITNEYSGSLADLGLFCAEFGDDRHCDGVPGECPESARNICLYMFEVKPKTGSDLPFLCELTLNDASKYKNAKSRRERKRKFTIL